MGLAEIDQLHRGMNFRTKFGDPTVDEAAQPAHLVAYRRGDRMLDLLCLVRHFVCPICPPHPKTGDMIQTWLISGKCCPELSPWPSRSSSTPAPHRERVAKKITLS